MRRRRISIAALMAVVAVVGLGTAALRNANGLWAAVMFTVAVAAVSFATVGAAVRARDARLPWAGFAVFGWAAMGLWWASSHTAPLAGFGFVGAGGSGFGVGGGPGGFGPGGFGGRGFGGIGGGDVRPGLPLTLPVWGLGALRPNFAPAAARTMWDALAYAQVAHALDVLVFGLAGALLCPLAATRREPREVSAADALTPPERAEPGAG